MAPILKGRTRAEWRERLDAAGVPCAPIQNIAEALADAQTQALGIVQTGGPRGMPLVGLPVSFDGERPPLRREPPALGEDNDEIRGGRR